MNSSTNYWDAVVVGAGVAGGATAAMLAQRGWRVLLVERSAWPRRKVCGGFISGCSASLLPMSSSDEFRNLKLQSGNRTIEARAGIVIACDSIGRTLLAGEPWANWTISPGSLMGVATTYPSHSPSVSSGRIYMCMGNNGYVGMVRIDGSYENLAAALDRIACRAGGPENLVREILGTCGRSIPADLDGARSRGTGTLTRRRRHLGGYRVHTVGDACGYVEPLTGEGMAWAAMGAREPVNMLPNPNARWRGDLPARWRRRCLETIGRQHRWCRRMRTTAHHPAMAAAGIFIGNALPAFARWMARTICQPSTKEFRNDNPGRFRVAQASSRLDAGDFGHRHREPTGSAAGVALELAMELGCFDNEQRSWIKRVFLRSGIETRCSVLATDDEDQLRNPREFYPAAKSPEDRGPTTAQRMARYAVEAPVLAERSARNALEDAQIEPGRITHLVTASCTGFFFAGA